MPERRPQRKPHPKAAPLAHDPQDASSASAATRAVAELSEAWATLTPNGRKARYGVTYIRSICAQAGVGFHENSPDEDVLAVDCDIKFPIGIVSAQVKCTSQLTIQGNTASWPVKKEWVDKWQQNCLPVYFVIVMVPASASDWIEHDPAKGTFQRTAAFWRRIRSDERIGARIAIPKDQRFQASTLGLWYSDFLATFGPPGGKP